VSTFIEIEQSKLHYTIYGHGRKKLLAFHGFGQSAKDYNNFSNTIQDDYTVYSFDLFFHGESIWQEKEKPLEKEQLAQFVIAFLKKENVEQFSLVGYSLGAKFLLAILEKFNTQVDGITFIAPDGIKTNFWYSLATYPILLRRFFKVMILNPKPLFHLIGFLKKIRIVDKGLYKFATSQLITEPQRNRVYYSWTVFRHLHFDMTDIAALINTHEIKVEMYLGKYDRIITEKNMNNLLHLLDNYTLEILDTGHNTLLNDVAHFFSETDSDK